MNRTVLSSIKIMLLSSLTRYYSFIDADMHADAGDEGGMPDQRQQVTTDDVRMTSKGQVSDVWSWMGGHVTDRCLRQLSVARVVHCLPVCHTAKYDCHSAPCTSPARAHLPF